MSKVSSEHFLCRYLVIIGCLWQWWIRDSCFFLFSICEYFISMLFLLFSFFCMLFLLISATQILWWWDDLLSLLLLRKWLYGDTIFNRAEYRDCMEHWGTQQFLSAVAVMSDECLTFVCSFVKHSVTSTNSFSGCIAHKQAGGRQTPDLRPTVAHL